VAATRTDPAEHLGVEMDELAGSLALVTDDWLSRLQAIEPADAGPSQEGVDRRAGETGLPTEHLRSDSKLLPSSADPFGKLDRVSPSLAADDAAAIDEAGRTFGPISRPPLRSGLATYPGCLSGGSDRLARTDPIDQDRSTLGVKRALAWDMRALFSTAPSTPAAERYGPSPVKQRDRELELCRLLARARAALDDAGVGRSLGEGLNVRLLGEKVRGAALIIADHPVRLEPFRVRDVTTRVAGAPCG